MQRTVCNLVHMMVEGNIVVSSARQWSGEGLHAGKLRSHQQLSIPFPRSVPSASSSSKSSSSSPSSSTLGCIELGGKIKKVHFTYWLTLFSLYFLILRLVSFLAFFDLRLPSFANLNFCLLMGIRQNFNGKII